MRIYIVIVVLIITIIILHVYIYIYIFLYIQLLMSICNALVCYKDEVLYPEAEKHCKDLASTGYLGGWISNSHGERTAIHGK